MVYVLAVGIIVGILVALAAAAYLIGGHRRIKPFVRFLARYLAVFALLFVIDVAIMAFFPSLHLLLRNSTASFVGGILRLADVNPTISGSIISLENPLLAFDITIACLANVLFWIYIGLVWAEPRATFRQRLIGIAMGLAILLAFNILRIALSIYLEWATGVYVHNYFYLFNMVFVLLIWAGWLWTLRPKAGHLQSH